VPASPTCGLRKINDEEKVCEQYQKKGTLEKYLKVKRRKEEERQIQIDICLYSFVTFFLDIYNFIRDEAFFS
jgi:hypothetical protein